MKKFKFLAKGKGDKAYIAFSEKGVCLVGTDLGKLLICHAHGITGELIAPMAAVEKAELIACCFPAQVKARYPAFAQKVIGDWSCSTSYRWSDEELTLSPVEDVTVEVKKVKRRANMIPIQTVLGWAIQAMPDSQTTLSEICLDLMVTADAGVMYDDETGLVHYEFKDKTVSVRFSKWLSASCKRYEISAKQEWISIIASYLPKYDASLTFEEVSGEGIRRAYLRKEKDFHETEGHEGEGPESCMAHGSCQQFLDLYVENTDVFSLIKIFNAKGVYFGRALKWTLPDGRVFLDRIYPSDGGSHVYTMMRYASKRGWTYKDEQSHSSPFRDEMGCVDLKLPSSGKYPYMDTTQWVIVMTEDTITLSDRPVEGARRRKLVSTSGRMCFSDVQEDDVEYFVHENHGDAAEMPATRPQQEAFQALGIRMFELEYGGVRIEFPFVEDGPDHAEFIMRIRQTFHPSNWVNGNLEVSGEYSEIWDFASHWGSIPS